MKNLAKSVINMKTIRIIFLVFIMIACSKEDDGYRSVGTITGIDGTMCGCCGGWIINIDSGQYLIDSMPKNSGIDLSNETFPITVKLDWQLVNNDCSFFGRIAVQRVIKI
jgi:hypothetical protein